MNLCLVTREYPPNPLGGIGTYVVNFCRLLARAGHEVTVLTQASPEAPEAGLDRPVLNGDGIRVYYLPFVGPRWELLPGAACSPAARALARLDIAASFAQIAADALEVVVPRHGIAIVEGAEYEAPLAVHLARRHLLPAGHPARSVPCVVHLHSPSHLIFEHNDEDLSLPWIGQRRRLEMASIRAADALLSPSAFLAAQVCRDCDLPEDSIRVLPYPIGDPLPPRGNEASWPTGFQCVHVGRVEPRKGVFEWVEAAVQLLEEGADLQLHFVGGPHQRATTPEESALTTDLLRERIPAAHRKRFHFHKQVPRDELGEFYERADLCIVASRWDNFPNTCLEAMSCGKPVLASDQGGMAEIIEDGVSGFLARAPYGDRAGLVQALAARVREILAKTPEERAQIGEAGRMRIQDLCDNHRILGEHLDWYAELIAADPFRATESIREEPRGPAFFWLAPAGGDPAVGTEARTTLEALEPAALRVEEFFLEADTVPREAPLAPLAEQVASLPPFAWVVLLGPGILPTADYNRILATLGETRGHSFAVPWLSHSGESDPEVFSAVDPANLLQRTRGAGLAAAFRAGPLVPLLRESVPASFLRDVNQHLLIRLQELGHDGIIVPTPLAVCGEPTGPLWRHGYGFAAERDSRLALLRAHARHLEFPFHGETLAALSPSPVAERRPARVSASLHQRPRLWERLFRVLRR